MIHAATKCSRAAAAAIRGRRIAFRRSLVPYSTPLRSIHGEISVPNTNHVAIQMVNYALSHARSQKSGFFDNRIFQVLKPLIFLFVGFLKRVSVKI